VAIETIEEGRIAHVNIRSFNHGNIEPDAEIILPFLQSIGGYEHLIIDIRGNGGGSSNYFPIVFMQHLINEPVSWRFDAFFMGGGHALSFEQFDEMNPVTDGLLEGFPHLHPDDAPLLAHYVYGENYIEPSDYTVGFNGKIWLLVDGRNFSAADFAAVVTQQTGFAAIVGEPTGGAGIGANPIVFALPNSGIAGRFQAMYTIDGFGRNSYEFTTQPDIFNHEGMDALQTVLTIIEEGAH